MRPRVALLLAVVTAVLAACTSATAPVNQDCRGGGVTSAFGDAHALAAEIETMLNDPDRRQRMGEGGRQLALEYDGDTAWRRTTGEMEQVVAMVR